MGKKMTFDIFDMGGDISDQLPQIARNYWYFTFLVIGNGVALWRFYPRKKKEVYVGKDLHVLKIIPIGITILILTAITVRGGVQLRSLSPKNAFVFEKYELGNFSLNAAYTMIRSIGKKGISKETYFETDIEAKAVIMGEKTFYSDFKGLKNQNVIVIIIESLSQEYIEEGYAPFIKQLSLDSLNFKQSFANGRRSIEVLPSIMAGFPSIIGKPLYQSQYQSNKYYTLPETLRKKGYETSFFHGGKTGTMDFDAYCKSIGFSSYYGKEDYPNSKDYDGYWGIYDDKFLDFFIQKSKAFKEPFLSSIFTLSSHQPYSLPKDSKGKFPKGDLDIHESIGYVDNSLKEFFKKAQLQPWFENTLFVITADHTQKLKSKKFNSVLGRYRVPIIFFHPKMSLEELTPRKIAQHVDIFPSIMDFLEIEQQDYLLYGSSVFSNSSGMMINAINGSYLYLKGDNYIRYDKKTLNSYNLNDTDFKLSPSAPNQKMLEELKAYIQYTNNGLRSNQMYK
jgi:uncharacterized sulfatase